MLYVNRDALGLPDLAEAARTRLEGSGTLTLFGALADTDPALPHEDGTAAIDVSPHDGSLPYLLSFYPPEMAACDGTLEQCAEVGLLLAELARAHGVRMVALWDDASHALSLEEADTVDTLVQGEWTPIDPNTVGTGDILEINAQDHRR